MSQLSDYRDFRSRMNKRILDQDNLVIKRIYSVDTLAYQPGALDSKVKEMLGLVSSMVLRCDDCVKYHLERYHALGVTTDELFDIAGIATLVGGTVVIPQTRRAIEFWDHLCNDHE